MNHFKLMSAILLVIVPVVYTVPTAYASAVAADSAAYRSIVGINTDSPGDSIRKAGFFRRVGNYFRESNRDRTLEKKIDFSIIGGPHYSSDVKLGLGLVAAGLYRIDKTDLSIPPSNVSIFGDITTSGFYLIGVTGNTYFNGGSQRIDYTTSFSSMPGDFWGFGYYNGLHNEASKFDRKQIRINLDLMQRVARNTYIGLSGSFNYIKGSNFTRPDYLGSAPRTQYTSTGAGSFIVYDSRDLATNASRGWYVNLNYKYYPKFFGNDASFSRTELTVDFYHKIWEGGIMAYDLHSLSLVNSGHVPWTMLAMMGGSKRMRGYYEGRFRDKGLMEIQAELRQKVWRRIGVTAWVGAGNVFPTLSSIDWSHTLPNYGIGFRWEFKNRVNVRLDYGFGHKESGFIFNINEAF